MDIRAERSEVGPEAEGIPIFVGIAGDVIRSPRINSTVAETTVSAANGQTIVLGGLLTKAKSETHRRVPLLADIPILGHLFRYDNVQSRRTELLIIMTPHVLRTREDAELFKQIEASRMSWCLADVIKMHGESGLRGRHAEWTDAETTVIYPDMTPEMIQSLRARSARRDRHTTADSSAPQDPLRLAPPSSPPPSQPGGSTPMRLPLEAPPRADPPPTLPSGQPQSGTRSPGIRPVAAPVVNGPTITPQQAGAAPRPVNQPAMQPAQSAAYYSARPGQALRMECNSLLRERPTGALPVASEVRIANASSIGVRDQEIRETSDESNDVLTVRHSTFDIRSSFGFRHSEFPSEVAVKTAWMWNCSVLAMSLALATGCGEVRSPQEHPLG